MSSKCGFELSSIVFCPKLWKGIILLKKRINYRIVPGALASLQWPISKPVLKYPLAYFPLKPELRIQLQFFLSAGSDPGFFFESGPSWTPKFGSKKIIFVPSKSRTETVNLLHRAIKLIQLEIFAGTLKSWPKLFAKLPCIQKKLSEK